MAGLFFPYKRVISKVFGEVKIPVIKIFLRNGKEIGVDAIIDSGAVISVFPRSICDVIGIKKCVRKTHESSNSFKRRLLI